MNYTIEVYDAAMRRIARYHDTPVLEVWRRGPDQSAEIRGVLPEMLAGFGPGCTMRVSIAGAGATTARVVSTAPEWSDAQKLILEDYIRFREVLAFEAQGDAAAGNTTVSRTFISEEIADMVRGIINAAPGALHYRVDHAAYPDGAEREHDKFSARSSAANELEVGGIGAGDWVGAARIDATAAYAKDGDTIAGLVVDGEAWPDLRLMMIDCEETSRNSHAMKRHPEVAGWSDARYNASGYKLRADAAKAALQALLDTHGISHIELNPHRNALGEYDDRVDAYGRYIGLVYGGGQCFNAALIEQAHADVYLYENGRYHPAEMALKEYFSYRGVSADSIAATGRTLHSLDVRGGALEAIALLAYAAGGHVFDVDDDLAVTFRKPVLPARVVFFDTATMGARIGGDTETLGNLLFFHGNPEAEAEGSHVRGESMDAYGVQVRVLTHFGVAHAEDATLLCEGLLDDIAWPTPNLALTFFRGRADLRVGDVVELRSAPVRRLDAPQDDEWGGAYAGKLVGRVNALRHRIAGRHVETTVFLGSPLRSVDNPLSFLVRSQEPATTHFQFRLDDGTVGLEQLVHLD
jgi:endonuclease YncB( thermonuclease family)